MPGTVLGKGETAVIKTDKDIVLRIIYILEEVELRKQVKKAIIYNIRRCQLLQKEVKQRRDIVSVSRGLATINCVASKGLSEKTIKSDLKVVKE